MAQKALKKSNKTNNSKNKTKDKQLGLRKGARTIAPKKQSVIKQKNMEKKITLAINKNIEQIMVSRASAVAGGRKFNIVKAAGSDNRNKGDHKTKKTK
ncbi:3627_t:CDS:2 [Paraglomus occultum]|uniref:3627_t:CDS:1 n=1 Tax=Paraglomus occultum TaxID=144539 RepID=A0A9N8VX48_9GLOM|nr:3627_t:CDS:2 [Paraglomus occultum]